MTEQTLHLLRLLKQASSKSEALGLVTRKQEELKQRFEAKRVKFNPENHHDAQGIQGGQLIRDRDRADYEAYNEINFIRHGLTAGWYDRMDDQERYYQIQQEVQAIVADIP